jgi:hypothetical protein
MKTTLEHIETSMVSMYGGNKVIAEYMITHVKNHYTNQYRVTAEVRGIATAQVYIEFIGAESLNNNEETLITEGVEDLFMAFMNG